MKYFLLILANFILINDSSLVFAQGTVNGTVKDASSGEPLAGANLVVTGTYNGASTNNNGSFIINNVMQGETITASMIGYKPQTLIASGKVDFQLNKTALQLSPVTVAGNFAIERETPVAFTTIGEEHIKNHFTVQDIPHLFANTPGVYITSDGGSGMGDSKVTIRGFDEQRIAVMINNVPVNDPESKKVYWSNWGSLPSASQSIQVQRGVGSSMYGSGALGGSINVITKDAPAKENTEINLSYGQYGIRKYGFNYNSGLIDKNRAYLFRLNYLTGNGWRQNTFYKGLQYYFSSMLYSGNNTFKLIFHGAPQYHSYSYYGFSGAQFADYGYDWNGHPHVDENSLPAEESARATDLFDVLFMRTPIGAARGGQLGGWVVGNGRASLDNNVYHKPQIELHHNLSLNDNMSLTNTIFASKGYGYGENLENYYVIPREDDGNMNYNDINNAGEWQYRNYSDHFQTGFISNFDMKIMEQSKITVGAEFRYWVARHAGEILNTFADSDGLISYSIGGNEHQFGEGDLYYDYTTTKPQFTGFASGNWKIPYLPFIGEGLNIMTDIQFSSMNYKVVEEVPSSNNWGSDINSNHSSQGSKTWIGTAFWNPDSTETYDHDGNPSTEEILTPEIPVEYTLWEYEKPFSYISPKLGANYNFNDNFNAFINWSRAVNEPRVKYFFGYGSPNDALELEKTSDLEFGFGYQNDLFNLKYNWYNIGFTGKALRITDPTKTNTLGYDYKGRRYIPIGDATYSGNEFALNLSLTNNLVIGMNLSSNKNLWGEPVDSKGAQFLYNNAEVKPGIDYLDSNSDGYWDSGERALHKNFVDKFGNRSEVGMPQLIYGSTINWSSGPFTFFLASRHYEKNYILQNNGSSIVEAGDDGTWGNDDDIESEFLPSATIYDTMLRLKIDELFNGSYLSLHINNILNERYWQTGDDYGFKPGTAQTILINLGVSL